MNNIILSGRLVADPEVKSGKDWTLCKFTLAVPRVGTEETDFIGVECWNKRAEFAGQYFKKGMRVLVQGELHITKYESDDGNRYITAVSVNNLEFADGKKEDEKPTKKYGRR